MRGRREGGGGGGAVECGVGALGLPWRVVLVVQ